MSTINLLKKQIALIYPLATKKIVASTLSAASLLLASPLASANNSCYEGTTPLPPFYGSSVTGINREFFDFTTPSLQEVYSPDSNDITTENFRDLNSNPKGYISKNTLVRVMGEMLDVFQINKTDLLQIPSAKGGFFVPVEILKPEVIYSRMKKRAERELFVNTRDQGLIFSGSLRPVTKDYLLIIDSDMQTLAGQQLKRGQLLRPVVDVSADQENYKVTNCETNAEKDFYHFYVQNGKKAVAQTLIYPATDGTRLSPIHSNHLQGLIDVQTQVLKSYKQQFTLADLEMDYKGFVRMPMRDESVTTAISGTALDGSFVHYHGGDPEKSDTWGKPNTICALIKLAQAWDKKCKGSGCTLQIGDIAFPTAAINARDAARGVHKDPLYHSTHKNGECIDIRPFRKDDELLGSTHLSSIYDPKKSRDFLLMAAKHGANVIYFNDKKAIEGIPVASTMPGHDNHYHICFPSTRNYCN